MTALALACALVAVLAAPPGATSSVDVSTGLNGMLIESRGDSRSTVVVEESDRFFTGSAAAPRPAGATTYLVEGRPCEFSRNLLGCARVKPRHLLCEPFTFSEPIVCPRTSLPQAAAPGVRVRFGRGDDRLAFGRVPDAPDSCSAGLCSNFLADPFRINAGGGDDDIRAFSRGVVLGENQATGRWTVSLGAGDDRYRGSLGRDVVNGGAGDDVIDADGPDITRDGPGGSGDRIRAGSGDDRVDPGPGRDVVQLGAGADSVDASDDGPDSYDGGPGVDRISYQSRTRGITAGVAFTSAGERGEGDLIRSFERVDGGRGPDRILGFRVGNGGPGDDVVTGGNRGRFVLVGGPGSDVLRGLGGNDIINARDGERDRRIECGAGIDRVFLDRQDPAPADGSCERVERRGG